MYRPKSKHEWLFCGILGAQALIILAIEAFILAEWQLWVHPNIIQITPSYIVPVDSAIMFFACIYVFLLALDAVHHRNNVLLLAICVSNACALVFSVMLYRNMEEIVNEMPSQRDGLNHPLVDQDRNIWTLIQGFQLACPIMIGLCTLATWASSFQLQKQYAWAIYRSVRGDSETKSRYLNYEIYLVLVKVAVFFIICFVLQYGLVDVHFEEPEFGLTMALLPATLLLMILGVYVVRFERKWPMGFVIVCYLAMVAYLLSRIIILYGDGFRALTAGKDMMLFFAITALVLLVLTLICSIRCFMNFGHGLKPIITGKDEILRDSHDFHSIGGHAPFPVEHTKRRLSLV
ncbi:unnamed protein product [Penicillium salamii]|uniref:Uncharacterized protein n=1 Tax=Penicillium salamii TaxID=1612424 RepID=A0A9W4NVC1_9EURO|nr:unnamed protein product [Penicillium salamii]CAG8098000.1 unnamed protein product [Penicillium salamii]CAG8172592.1 unnamed protein product [Penicillium salamii]CAG8190463.1 unnamed protein product [Penicillium salamii]CAG8219186.1 unnamed protein product [Penicillium salamii]